MLDFGFYNMDCMEGMKEFPDKYFDLLDLIYKKIIIVIVCQYNLLLTLQ